MTTMGLLDPTECATLHCADVDVLEHWVERQRIELERLTRRLHALEAHAQLAEESLPGAGRDAGDEAVLGTVFRGADADLPAYFWREVPTARGVARSLRRRVPVR